MKQKETRRSLQAQETKNRIYEAALKLFGQQGIDNVTISDLAEEAGCSTGNIYHYFKSKEEIAAKTLQLVDGKYAEFYQRMQTEEPYLSMSASERLSEFFCETIRVCADNPQLRNSYALAVKNPELKTLHINEDRDFFKICTELLLRMQQAGELSERVSVQEGKSLVLMLLRGVLVDWLVSGQDYDVMEQARMMAGVMLNGMKR